MPGWVLPHVNGAKGALRMEVFERSPVPMSLLNRERRYVAVNDALVKLYECRDDELIGARAGRAIVDDDESSVDARWDLLLRSGEVFGERVVAVGGGSLLRVGFAGHATTMAGHWFALFVIVSARNEADDRELIGTRRLTTADAVGLKLTRREREIVRLLAGGASTYEISAELGLSEETVRAHVRNAREKTKARTRAQLVAIALARGLIDTE